VAEPRKPQDHKPKQEPDDGYFTYTAGGKQYTMRKKTRAVVTPGYNRRHRKLDAEDRIWTILEDLADKDAELLQSFENMTNAEWEQCQMDMITHMGGTPGE
jgi:hypothetical protein